jgi:peptidoglycan/LPS O-acetylase OafA/YrhL
VAGLENLGILKKSWARFAIAGMILWLLIFLASACVEACHVDRSFAINEIMSDSAKIAAGLLLFFVANPAHPIARLLCSPWLRWCGIISYEWYLFHQPITGWARQSFGPADGDPLRFAAIVGGSFLAGLVIAVAVYRFFSLPILKYGRGKNQASKPA